MIAKGKNQHVLPDGNGWCVVDEVNQMVVLHFVSREEALSYANAIACQHEGMVLMHNTECHTGSFSSVALPQERLLYAEGHAKPLNYGRACSDFDPFLGFDEYYFDI